MGYYLETPSNHNKVEQLLTLHGGHVCCAATARDHITNPTLAPVCVVDNGPFEAAAFIHSQREFDAFTHPDDPRPKTFVLLPREVVERESGWKR